MTEQRSALDNALDLFVYAPVGLALTAAEEIPKLAARGRAQVEGQMTMAKMVGQFAVAQGRKEIEKRLGLGAQPKPTAQPEPAAPPRERAPAGRTTSNGSGSNPRAENGSYERLSGRNAAGRSTATAPAPAATDENQDAAVIDVDFGTTARSEPTNFEPTAGSETSKPTPLAASTTAASDSSAPTQPGPSADGLAIPGYDSLSASQVVQRLAGLSQEELAAVGEYETAHRGRRTILTRVGQLKG